MLAADEVLRVEAVGAEVFAEHGEWGIRWTVLTDPEGNPALGCATGATGFRRVAPLSQPLLGRRT
jgi:hypothetical protein